MTRDEAIAIHEMAAETLDAQITKHFPAIDSELAKGERMASVVTSISQQLHTQEVMMRRIERLLWDYVRSEWPVEGMAVTDGEAA